MKLSILPLLAAVLATACRRPVPERVDAGVVVSTMADAGIAPPTLPALPIPPPAGPGLRSADEVATAACSGAHGWMCPSRPQPMMASSGPVINPPSWSVPAWYVDPANVSGSAADSNPCTTALQPCLTTAQIAQGRWGTFSPPLPQNPTLTMMSDDTASDPWQITPAAGGTLTVVGSPIVQTTVTIGTYTPRVFVSTPSLDQITAVGRRGAFWTPFVGMLVNDTTKGAWFRVYSDLGGGAANISAPVGNTGSQSPPWVTIAAGDSLTIYRTPRLYVSSLGGAFGALKFRTLTLTSPPTSGLTSSSGTVSLDRCQMIGLLLGATTAAVPNQLTNCDIDGTSYVQVTGQYFAGQARAGSNLLLAGISPDFCSVVDGDAIFSGFTYVQGFFKHGAASWMGGNYADVSRQPATHILAPISYGVARQWGNASFSVSDGTQIGIGSEATAVNKLLLTGGYNMDGLTTGLASVSSSGTITTGVALTPAEIDSLGNVQNPATGSRVFIRH